MSTFKVIEFTSQIPTLFPGQTGSRKAAQQYEAFYSNLKTRDILKLAGDSHNYQRKLIQLMSIFLFCQGLVLAIAQVYLEEPEFLCKTGNGLERCPKVQACQTEYQLQNSLTHLTSVYRLECSQNWIILHLSSLLFALSGVVAVGFVLVADLLGRKNAFFVDLSVQIVLGIFIINGNMFWAAVVLLVILMGSNLATLVHAFLLLNESIGGKLRVISLGIGFVAIALSRGFVITLLYAVSDVKITFVVILSALSLSFLCLPFITESPFFVKNHWKLKDVYTFFVNMLERNSVGDEFTIKKKHLFNYLFNVSWKSNVLEFEKQFAREQPEQKKESTFQSIVEDEFEIDGNMSLMSFRSFALSTLDQKEMTFSNTRFQSDQDLPNQVVQVKSDPQIAQFPDLPDVANSNQNDEDANRDSLIIEEQEKQESLLIEDQPKVLSKRDQNLISFIENMRVSKILRRYSQVNRGKVNHQVSYMYLLSNYHMKGFLAILFLSLSTTMTVWLCSSSEILFTPDSYYGNLFLNFFTEIFCGGLCILILLFVPRRAILIVSQWGFLHVGLVMVVFAYLFGLSPENYFCLLILKPLIYTLFIVIRFLGFAATVGIVIYVCETFPTFLRALVLGLCVGLGRCSVLFVIENARVMVPKSMEGFGLVSMLSVMGMNLALILGDSRTNGMLN